MSRRPRKKSFGFILAVAVVASASVLSTAMPAFAATTATITGPTTLTPGASAPVDVALSIEVPTPPAELPALVGITVARETGTGAVTVSGGTAPAPLDGCIQTEASFICEWPGAAEGGTATMNATLTASADATGTFSIVVAAITGESVIPLATQALTIEGVSPPAPITGSVAVTGAATVGQPFSGASLSIDVPADATGDALPIGAGIIFALTGGTGTVAVTDAGAGPGPTNCITDLTGVLCEWAATAGSTGTITPTLVFDAVSTWTVAGFYVDGSDVLTPFLTPATIDVRAAAVPSQVPPLAALPATGLADVSPGILGAGIIAVLMGMALVVSARRQRRAGGASRL